MNSNDINNLWLVITLILLIILLIVKHLKRRKNKIYQIRNAYENNTKTNRNNQENYYPYHKKYLLTKNEYYFFKNLYKAIEPYNLSIIAKIRLADIIDVNSNIGKNYMSYFNKIKSKHIDFALVIPEKMEIKYLIELDDNSHNRNDRIERDQFVNNLLYSTGYKLLRTYSDLSEIINTIEKDNTITRKEITKKETDTNLPKIINDLYFKIGNIEKMLSDVDDTPYIIENEKEDG